MKFKSPKPPESVIQMAPMIDICQQAGIWNISFATRKPE